MIQINTATILLKLSNHSSIFRERFYFVKTLVSVWTLQVLKPRTPARTRAHTVRWALESVAKLRETRETVPWVQGKILGICPVLKDSWWLSLLILFFGIYTLVFLWEARKSGVCWVICSRQFLTASENRVSVTSSPVLKRACCGNKPRKNFCNTSLGVGSSPAGFIIYI